MLRDVTYFIPALWRHTVRRPTGPPMAEHSLGGAARSFAAVWVYMCSRRCDFCLATRRHVYAFASAPPPPTPKCGLPTVRSTFLLRPTKKLTLYVDYTRVYSRLVLVLNSSYKSRSSIAYMERSVERPVCLLTHQIYLVSVTISWLIAEKLALYNSIRPSYYLPLIPGVYTTLLVAFRKPPVLKDDECESFVGRCLASTSRKCTEVWMAVASAAPSRPVRASLTASDTRKTSPAVLGKKRDHTRDVKIKHTQAKSSSLLICFPL